jgi:ABC-type Fe3+/spermidine/putrescine transport system ATPase subunit
MVSSMEGEFANMDPLRLSFHPLITLTRSYFYPQCLKFVAVGSRTFFLQEEEIIKNFNTFEGKIEESTYVGETVKYMISLREGETISVKKPNVKGIPKYERGHTVKLGWHWEDANVFEV